MSRPCCNVVPLISKGLHEGTASPRDMKRDMKAKARRSRLEHPGTGASQMLQRATLSRRASPYARGHEVQPPLYSGLLSVFCFPTRAGARCDFRNILRRFLFPTRAGARRNAWKRVQICTLPMHRRLARRGGERSQSRSRQERDWRIKIPGRNNGHRH